MMASRRAIQAPLERPALPTIRTTTEFAALASRSAGLNLKPEKLDFFNQRLLPELRRTGCADFEAYCAFLTAAATEQDLKHFVEALTTHTTHFFREPAHFDWLGKTGWDAIVTTGAGTQRALVVWSAACSSGQELYSTLMHLQDWSAERKTALRVEGHGTDISERVLRRAAAAVFTGEDIRGIDEGRRRRYLLRARDGADRFRIEPGLRRLCRWSMLNLTAPGTGMPRRANLILLRNVLIYFDKPTQDQVVNSLVSRLDLGGVLMTGHSESLSRLPAGLEQVSSATYRRIA